MLNFKCIWIILLLSTIFQPTEARAQFDFFIIGWGNTATPMANVPSENLELLNGKDHDGFLKVGYKYDYISFGMPLIWTYGGSWCIMKTHWLTGNRYLLVSESEAAALLGKDVAELRPPFFFKWPAGIIAILWFVFLICCLVWFGEKIGPWIFGFLFSCACMYYWFG